MHREFWSRNVYTWKTQRIKMGVSEIVKIFNRFSWNLRQVVLSAVTGRPTSWLYWIIILFYRDEGRSKFNQNIDICENCDILEGEMLQRRRVTFTAIVSSAFRKWGGEENWASFRPVTRTYCSKFCTEYFNTKCCVWPPPSPSQR